MVEILKLMLAFFRMAGIFCSVLQAVATCARWNPAYVHTLLTRVPGSGYNSNKPYYACPAGATIRGCTTYSPWFGAGRSLVSLTCLSFFKFFT